MPDSDYVRLLGTLSVTGIIVTVAPAMVRHPPAGARHSAAPALAASPMITGVTHWRGEVTGDAVDQCPGRGLTPD